LLVLALLFPSVVGAEKAFKYQDENGNWAYSQSLPASEETVQEVVLTDQVPSSTRNASSIPVSKFVFKFRDDQGNFVYSQYSPVSGKFQSIKLSPDAVPHRGKGGASTPLYNIIYKFPDAEGKWVYSQYLPSSSIPEENIEQLVSYAPYSSSQKETATEGESLQATEHGQTAEQLAKAAESRKIKEMNCRKARERLEKAGDPRNDLLKTAEGLFETVTEAKRLELIEVANQHIEEFCE
jgi:hypothetical protein